MLRAGEKARDTEDEGNTYYPMTCYELFLLLLLVVLLGRIVGSKHVGLCAVPGSLYCRGLNLKLGIGILPGALASFSTSASFFPSCHSIPDL